MSGSMTRRVVRYSLKRDGDRYLSPNFQVKEFACKDGADEILIDLRLVYILQRVRDYFGRKVVINSGYRTRAYNVKVHGVPNSQHIKGTAADIVVSGVYPDQVAAFVDNLLVNTGGIGRYAGFTHIDTRLKEARWSG